MTTVCHGLEEGWGKGRWHILANAHPVISVKVFQRLILRGKNVER